MHNVSSPSRPLSSAATPSEQRLLSDRASNDYASIFSIHLKISKATYSWINREYPSKIREQSQSQSQCLLAWVCLLASPSRFAELDSMISQLKLERSLLKRYIIMAASTITPADRTTNARPCCKCKCKQNLGWQYRTDHLQG